MRRRGVLFAGAVIGVIGVVSTLGTMARAATPEQISYQGLLKDNSGDPVNGPATLTITIWPTPAGGSPLWQDDFNINVVDGLFTVYLGSGVTPLPQSVFTASDRWIGVSVNNQAELPRTQMVSVPYSYRVGTVDGATGGTISGNTSIASDLTVSGNVEATGANSKVRFFVNDFSELPPAGTVHGMVAHVHNDDKLYFAHAGQWVAISNEAHTHDATTISDEPGIASNNSTAFITLAQGITTMVDLVTCTLTTPRAGYIRVQGQTNLVTQGTTGANYGYVQIDETAGGDLIEPYFCEAGQGISSGASSRILHAERVYSKPAGTHVFRLEGLALNGNGAGAQTFMFNHFITATFYPTNYGTVKE